MQHLLKVAAALAALALVSAASPAAAAQTAPKATAPGSAPIPTLEPGPGQQFRTLGGTSAPHAGKAKGAPTVYDFELLQTGPLPEALRKQMLPLQTLSEIEDLLKQNRIRFQWGHLVLTTDKMNPEFIRKIADLSPREVFIVQQGDGWAISVIESTR